MKKVAKYALAMSLLYGGLSFFSTSATARIDLMSNRQLVVLSETKLLDDYRNPSSIVGSISGMQMVEVACTLNDSNCLANNQGKEYIRIKTWIGEKWIEDDNKITAGGYWEEDRDITLVEDMKLYDQPDVGVYSSAEPPKDIIAPQKVHVTAIYNYLYKGAHTGKAMLEAPMWYRIQERQCWKLQCGIEFLLNRGRSGLSIHLSLKTFSMRRDQLIESLNLRGTNFFMIIPM
ncbi:MAG: hypothetical protein K0Q73_9321 [Paenibacillus sp.]|nr:hypothetical protein [Paenibacillus sp.]